MQSTLWHWQREQIGRDSLLQITTCGRIGWNRSMTICERQCNGHWRKWRAERRSLCAWEERYDHSGMHAVISVRGWISWNGHWWGAMKWRCLREQQLWMLLPGSTRFEAITTGRSLSC